jgi:hypothetical protein
MSSIMMRRQKMKQGSPQITSPTAVRGSCSERTSPSELSMEEESLALEIIGCDISSDSTPESNTPKELPTHPPFDEENEPETIFTMRMELDRPTVVATKDYYTHSSTSASVSIPRRGRSGSVVIPSKNRALTTSASISVIRVDSECDDCRADLDDADGEVPFSGSFEGRFNGRHQGFLYGSPQTPRVIPPSPSRTPPRFGMMGSAHPSSPLTNGLRKQASC